ncbi:hypothetical protein IP90_00700 [Luteimonas cucumeris]|uniref:YCII-related domain-containing protein n=1 Tax=Luteimonas cucumeris TaxID=985012 RepID=A0A562LA76_9GAMM|nr:hypothetical protein [Luteimonas cucumeris]TWI04567.1 hypothetical protein IP90_00700 [Luteimonas cucumeris]
MKKFLAIYTGSVAASEKAQRDIPDEAKRKERDQAGMQAWGAWVGKHEAAIVDNGSPLGKTKRVGPDGISDIRNAMAAYTIVEADSHEAAAKMFENHPHFAIFPGEAVEIMECLPMPGPTK